MAVLRSYVWAVLFDGGRYNCAAVNFVHCTTEGTQLEPAGRKAQRFSLLEGSEPRLHIAEYRRQPAVEA